MDDQVLIWEIKELLEKIIKKLTKDALLKEDEIFATRRNREERQGDIDELDEFMESINKDLELFEEVEVLNVELKLKMVDLIRKYTSLIKHIIRNETAETKRWATWLEDLWRLQSKLSDGMREGEGHAPR